MLPQATGPDFPTVLQEYLPVGPVFQLDSADAGAVVKHRDQYKGQAPPAFCFGHRGLYFSGSVLN